MQNKPLYFFAVLFVLMVFVAGPGGVAAQSPTPTPGSPQQVIVVVTATPAATPTPATFWGENNTALLMAVITAIIGLIFGVLLKPTFERLGKVLEEAVSQLGTGWGFKKRYLTHLIEEYRGLNIRGLKTRAPVTVELEQVYVSLHAQVPDHALGRQAPPAINIGQALAQHPRLAIVGGPGSGKTTLLAYLALTYARGDVKDRLDLREKRLSILVPLRQLKQILNVAEASLPRSLPRGGIPAPLRARLRGTLPRCPAFTDDARLRALFTDARLAPWRN